MTNEKTNTKTYFTINFFEGTISGTKTSFNRAGRGISPYYEELTEKMNAHPTFTLVIKEPKKKSDKPKRTYFGMDFKFMEKYISIQKNSEQLMVEYKAVKKFAEDAHLSVYPTTKKWFLGEFDPDGEGFDMAKAKEEIKQFGMGNAILNAQKENDDTSQTKTENAISTAELPIAV